MRFLERAFDWYGRFVARHPLPFLIVPFVITVISVFGVFNFHSQDDIWDIYAPLNAQSRVEEKAFENFEYMASAHHYRLQVIVDRKDGGNLMNFHDLAEITGVNRFIAENMTISTGDRQWLYHDICGIYCNDSNALIIGIVQAIFDSKGQTSRLEFTYPNANAFHNQVFMGYSIGRLKTVIKNGKDVIQEFRMFILHYMVNMRLPQAQLLRNNFESQLLRFFEHATMESPTLQYALLSRNRELEEQRKITTTAIPYLFVTGAALTLFMIITLIDRPLYKSQFIEAIFGILSPTMALITTFGLVWQLGYPFSNILTVVPFLVITIGIDDAFLILAGWRHSNPNEDLEVRIGESVAKSGASVSVTSVTDVLCFGVGIFSNLPVVQLFCLYTSIALTIDFIYQLTFFLAITVYCCRRQLRLTVEHRINKMDKELQNSSNIIKTKLNESITDYFTIMQSETNANKIQGSKKMETISNKNLLMENKNICVFNFTNNSINNGLDERCQSKLSNPKSDNKSTSIINKFFTVSAFIDFILLPMVQASIFGIFGAHLAISTYFCTFVNTDFDMENLYLRDSPLTPISQKMQNFVLKESFVVNFVLRNMGSFEDNDKRQLFYTMIDELEQIPRYGMGDSRGTTLWLRDYEAAASFWVSEDESSIWEPTELLRNYRAFNFGEKYIRIRLNEKNEAVIDSFTWIITYHNMNNFIDVEHLLDLRRDILKKYSAVFSVHSHHPLEKVPTESAKSAPANFMQTAVSAVILMSILVFLCILNVDAIFCVIISIISISIGTVGYLHLWDVNLDAVSLISMLMSIGFSVDYSAHICYHFYTHSIDDEEEKKKKQSLQVMNSNALGGTNSLNSKIFSNSSTTPISSIASSVGSESCLSVSLLSTDLSILAQYKNNKNISTDIESNFNYLWLRHRLIHTFNAIGWPVVQSGMSTVLGMVPLFFVDAYVVDVFWKTIILVTTLGMFHALLLLPILFVAINNLRHFFSRKKIFAEQSSMNHKSSIQFNQQTECCKRREILTPITLRVNE